MTTTPRANRRQSGFTLIEAIIAILIVSIGILALIAAYTQGFIFATASQYDYIAEKKAQEAIETLFTARDTKLINWQAICNVGGNCGGGGGGVFLAGPRRLLDPGPDGLVGTADDDPNKPDKVVVGPGPDGILGTADDDVIILGMMTRTIAIADIPGNPNLRQITVTINYRVGQFNRQFILVSYISSFA